MCSQALTLRGILEQMQVDKEHDSVLWHFYRVHTAKVPRLWRDEWCLRNDFVIVALSNGEVFLWNVGTAQLERRLVDTAAARQFQLDRGFAVSDAVPLLVQTQIQHEDGTCRAYSAHPLHRASPHLVANVVVLDVAAILRDSLKSVDIAKCALSLLMDWDLHSNSGDELEVASVMQLDVRPCYGHLGDYGSLTLVFPRTSSNGGKWKVHRHERAIHARHHGAVRVAHRPCRHEPLHPATLSVFAAVDAASAGKYEPTNDEGWIMHTLSCRRRCKCTTKRRRRRRRMSKAPRPRTKRAMRRRSTG